MGARIQKIKYHISRVKQGRRSTSDKLKSLKKHSPSTYYAIKNRSKKEGFTEVSSMKHKQPKRAKMVIGADNHRETKHKQL